MLRESFLEEITFEQNQKVQEEMDGTRGIESGCEGKEKGISGKGTTCAKMWNRACVTFGHDSLWLEVSARQGVVGERAGWSTHTHTCTHIQSFWLKAIEATLQ